MRLQAQIFLFFTQIKHKTFLQSLDKDSINYMRIQLAEILFIGIGQLAGSCFFITKSGETKNKLNSARLTMEPFLEKPTDV